MPRRFIVRPLAEADLEEAARWHEDERAELVERFLGDGDQTFGRIRERPLQFPTVSGDVRRALLHTFPYAVYFLIEDLLGAGGMGDPGARHSSHPRAR